MRLLSGSIAAIGMGLGAGWFCWPALKLAQTANTRTQTESTAKNTPDHAELEAAYHSEILPIFENYCYDCHGDGVKKGELELDRFPGIREMIADRDVWKRIRDHIDFRLMPPPDEYQPEDDEREKLLTWIDAAVFPVDPENPDPGHVTLRRLNRVEYRNTIRDLLGVDVDVDSLLPPDDSGYGFDNIGDVLTLSPAHLERYLQAARIALDEAVHPDPMPLPQTSVAGRDLHGNGRRSEDGHFLHTNGEAFANLHLPGPGRYTVRINAGGTMGGTEHPRMELSVNGRKRHEWSVKNRMDSPGPHETEIRLDHGGRVKISAAFTNDFWNADEPNPARRDRNLMVNRITVTGPLDGPPREKPETHLRIYGEHRNEMDDTAYMRDVLTRFARRAFRRPPEPGEVERYDVFLALAREHGDGVDHGIRLALEAMLVSPAFLFREEPAPETPDDGGKRLISEHALASRLSYFLWSTMPDEHLLGLADKGELRANLSGEIARMISSEKASAFVSNFAGQWLQLRDLDSVSPDLKRFGRFDQNLARDLRTETELLFSHILQENLPATLLLDADFTFINGRVAGHYGIKDVKGPEFRRVDLTGTPRRGILGHGSVLTLTSHPTRTSPVLRGKYVLENLLDTPPPPPPPNIPQLESPESHGKNLSLREQMERHRDDPSCSSCHALMDPIGFGLENFDAVGSWRDYENGLPIDAAGSLVSGHGFKNADELRQILTSHHRPEFHRALATKLLTYALGRGLDWYDRPAIEGVVRQAESQGATLQAFIHAAAGSVPFQYRR